MAIIHKKSYDETLKQDLIDTIFGNPHPQWDIQLNDFGIQIHITECNYGKTYWSKFNKDYPYNNIHISGCGGKGIRLVMDYVPEDFKMYNETGNYIKCELRNEVVLKGDIVFSNIILETYQFLSFTSYDNYLPIQLYQILKEVTSLDFGKNGGIRIIYNHSIYPDNYKPFIFEQFMEKYELFQKHLSHLPYIQLLVDIPNERMVHIGINMGDKDKCYYI